MPPDLERGIGKGTLEQSEVLAACAACGQLGNAQALEIAVAVMYPALAL